MKPLCVGSDHCPFATGTLLSDTELCASAALNRTAAIAQWRRETSFDRPDVIRDLGLDDCELTMAQERQVSHVQMDRMYRRNEGWFMWDLPTQRDMTR
jgi:hypothetical protein